MLCLTCTMISSIESAHYAVYHVKDWISVNCGTSNTIACYIIVTTPGTFIPHQLIKNIPFSCLRFFYLGLVSETRLRKAKKGV